MLARSRRPDAAMLMRVLMCHTAAAAPPYCRSIGRALACQCRRAVGRGDSGLGKGSDYMTSYSRLRRNIWNQQQLDQPRRQDAKRRRTTLSRATVQFPPPPPRTSLRCPVGHAPKTAPPPGAQLPVLLHSVRLNDDGAARPRLQPDQSGRPARSPSSALRRSTDTTSIACVTCAAPGHVFLCSTKENNCCFMTRRVVAFQQFGSISWPRQSLLPPEALVLRQGAVASCSQ